MKRPSWGLLIPVTVLTAGALLEIFAQPLVGPRGVLVATALVYSLALLFAPRHPLPAVATSCAALALMAVAAPDATNAATGPLFAGLGGAFLVARHGSRHAARAGLAPLLATLVLVAKAQPGLASGSVTFFVTAVLVAVAWGVGFSLRTRDAQASDAELRAIRAEAERDAAARVAVAEERSRIARELHDVVAHAVSVMVLQSGAVRHNLPADRAEDKVALQAVERAGREALTEMRRLLGAMRSDDEAPDRAPQPSLDAVPKLVEDVRRAGLAASLDVRGAARPLARGVELSAYRIVQEGLTNALKHAHAGRVEVRLTYADDALAIEVCDDGSGPAGGEGLGHGLIGVRERVSLYGGEMSAGRGVHGGFVLRSRLPLATP